MTKAQARIQEFLDNHPDILIETGTTEEYYVAKLKLIKEYVKFSEGIVYANILLFLGEIEKTAYNQLLLEESVRKEMTPDGYKSDAYLKGIIANILSIRNHITEMVGELEDTQAGYKEYCEQKE